MFVLVGGAEDTGGHCEVIITRGSYSPDKMSFFSETLSLPGADKMSP